jgi:hypothetical protein
MGKDRLKNELENIWKDGAVCCFEFVSRNLSGVAEEKNGNRAGIVDLRADI